MEDEYDEADLEADLSRLVENSQLFQEYESDAEKLGELRAGWLSLSEKKKSLAFPQDYLEIQAVLEQVMAVQKQADSLVRKYLVKGPVRQEKNPLIVPKYEALVSEAQGIVCKVADEARKDKEDIISMQYAPRKKNIFSKLDDMHFFMQAQQRTISRLDQLIQSAQDILPREWNLKQPGRRHPGLPAHPLPEHPFPNQPSPHPSPGKDGIDEKIKKRVDWLTQQYIAQGGKGSILVRLDYARQKPDSYRTFMRLPHAQRQEIQQEIGEFVKRQAQTGGQVRVFKHIPYLALDVDMKDEARILGQLKKKGMWGYHKYASCIAELLPTTLHFLPEQFAGIEDRVNKDIAGLSPKPDNYIWNLMNIGVPAAHQLTKGRGAKVLVIDTGADYKHQELMERFDPAELGWNFVDSTPDPMDKHGHGTHVSGTIAGTSVGVAPEAQLYAACCLNENGSGTTADIISGIEYGIDKRVHFISMSLGSPFPLAAMAEVCKAAYTHGIAVIAAAGNDGSIGQPSYPAGYPGVIGVAAVNRDNHLAEFSNINETNDISAPGVDIYSAVPRQGFSYLSGTSMATPHVTGSLSLVKSLHPELQAKMLEEILTHPDCVQHIGDDYPDAFGAGLVRPDLMLAHVHGEGEQRQMRGEQRLRQGEQRKSYKEEPITVRA
ncbi:MAG: S8 family peptidase [Nanoarchaeota archaeon]